MIVNRITKVHHAEEGRCVTCSHCGYEERPFNKIYFCKVRFSSRSKTGCVRVKPNENVCDMYLGRAKRTKQQDGIYNQMD